MRDEEIMPPGTFEYAERVRLLPDVSFHWLVAHQPIINIFNREVPYWWVFDKTVDPEKWVRRPPAWAEYIAEPDITRMTIPERFPPAPGKTLFATIGLRAQESNTRKMSVYITGGYLTGANQYGTRNARPIYDWTDGDVWRAVRDNKWDYNHAYDTMARLGIPRRHLRIGPPTINGASIQQLPYLRKAWPKWFEKVCERLPGVRSVTLFGKRAISPERRLGENWEQTFKRECIERAPAWISDRAKQSMETRLRRHSYHSTDPFPQNQGCQKCQTIRSWKGLTEVLYTGDPFVMKAKDLKVVEPEFFRAGAGTWGGGKPTW